MLEDDEGRWEPATEPIPPDFDEDDVGRPLEPERLEPPGIVSPWASWIVTMRSPGDTVEVDFSLDPTMVPSLETNVLVDVDCFKELGVIVEVEEDLDLSGVRWASLSSTGPYD